MFRSESKEKIYSSLIHKLSPITKYLIIITSFMSLIITNTTIEFIFVGLYLLNLIVWSNISLNPYLKIIFLSLLLSLIIFPLISVLSINFLPIFIKLIYLSLFITHFLSITSETDHLQALTVILKPLSPFLNPAKLALRLTSCITFLPRLIYTSKKLNTTFKLGLRYSHSYPKIITKFHHSIIQTKHQTTIHNQVLEERLVIALQERNKYILNKWQKIDTILLAIIILVLTITLIY